jgi:hypothetical protein
MDWLGLVLDPGPVAVATPPAAAGTIVQQYRPATADRWRLGSERPPELRIELKEPYAEE